RAGLVQALPHEAAAQAVAAEPVVGLGVGERDLAVAQVVLDETGQLAVGDDLEPGLVRVVGDLDVHGASGIRLSPGPGGLAPVPGGGSAARATASIGAATARLPVTPNTAMAALSSPRVRGEPPKCAAFSAGNTATGRPSSMASRSVRNAATSSGRRPINRSPSAVARRPGRRPEPEGRMAGSLAVAYSEATKLTVST